MGIEGGYTLPLHLLLCVEVEHADNPGIPSLLSGPMGSFEPGAQGSAFQSPYSYKLGDANCVRLLQRFGCNGLRV